MKQLMSVLIILLVVFSSCRVGVPLYSERPRDNRTYEVEYLFEYDGCKVYRFYDKGNYVYFTNCEGDVTSIATDSLETQIKNHIRL